MITLATNNPKESDPEDKIVRIRHTVAIAGKVVDGVSKAPLVHALVQIVVATSPPAFQALVRGCEADPTWARRMVRIDRTVTGNDGLFYFLDLPPGNYELSVTAPQLGTRYGLATTSALSVAAQPLEQPVMVAWTEIALPPTQIHGVVTHIGAGEPIIGANVHICGDTQVMQTMSDGTYRLSGLRKGHPMVEVLAAHFAPVRRQVELEAGQDQQVDIQLTPD